jgi:4-amino-4-deoxy-L-arabinose transferase-like glycosyltransferase
MPDFFKRLSPLQASLLLIAATALWRLLFANAVGLSVDEAHYALYGLHLDWSYFDHPPMIGWLQAVALQFGDSNLALRVLPVMLFSCTGWVLYRVTLALFPHATPWLGFFSVALLQSGVMFQLLGMAMLPDTPLLLLGLLLLWVLHGIVVQGRVQYWWWLGVLLGLAALSKYTAITLLATVLLALTMGRQWRQLRSPWPWLAMLVSLLLILPILYWNYRHDWISFAYQLHHGTGKPSWELRRFLAAQAAQLLAYGPGLFVFGLIAALAGLRHWRDSGVWLCLSLALPVLLLFGWGGGYEMTLPHWTALGWAGLAPLAAYWLLGHWNSRWVRIGVYSALAYALLALALVFSMLLMPWLLSQQNGNPLRDLYGWEQAAQRAEQLRQQMNAEQPGSNVPLFTDNWTYGSRLAWYARPAPVQISDARYDQFDVWFGSPQNGASGLLVLWPDAQAAPLTGGIAQFTECALRDRLPVSSHGQLISTFSFYACHGFRN